MCVFAALLLASCAPEAKDDVPALELTGRVVDAADILSPKFEAELTVALAELEGDTGVQLVVATTPDLQGYAIEDYALELGRDWGLGSEERLDGLMMLIAPTERTLRIEVGYGLEASVKDEEAAEIIREDVIPQFETGDYESGVRKGIERLIEEVTPYEIKEAA